MAKIQNSKRNSYTATFARLKKENRLGFCPFAVLGDPTETQTLARIKKYIEAGVDFLELGIPFSDPVADGPVIQAAGERALRHGMTPKKAIRLIKKIRRGLSLRVSVAVYRRSLATSSGWRLGARLLRFARNDKCYKIPIGILAYSNIIIRYGIAKFYRDLKKAGADSILIADVPLEEIAPFAKAAKKYKLHQIFLVSEYTDAARLKKIEKYASGFLYVVSVLGVTGARQKFPPQLFQLLARLKKQTKLPLVVGFGISRPEHLRQLKTAGANAAIVGSALVKTPLKKLSAAALFSFHAE